MKPKNILKSKTFWINALTAIGAYSGYLPQSPTTLYLTLAANLALRVITEQPVSLTAITSDAPPAA